MIQDPELREIFQVETGERLQRIDEGLLHLEKNPHDATTLRDLFREAHNIKGSARLLGETRIEKIAHAFEDMLGLASKGKLYLSSEVIDVMSESVKSMQEVVVNIAGGPEPVLSVTDLTNKLRDLEHAQSPVKVEKTPEREQVKVQRRRQIQRRKAAEPAEESVVPASEKEVATARQPASASKERPSENITQVEKTPEKGSDVESLDTKESETPADFRVDTIRVEPSKLDRLMNQVGELAVSNTRLRQRLSDTYDILADWEVFSRELTSGVRRVESLDVGDDIEQLLSRMSARIGGLYQDVYEDSTGLGIVSRDLEDSVRSLRMLPLSSVFNLFPRMLRDLSRTINRVAKLEIKGGDTRVDKHVLEGLKSPLTHMVRNALHHGLEEPAIRESIGKPRVGTIGLSAYNTSTHVIIEVEDDGRGFDYEKIKQTAVKNRLVSSDEAEKMTDEQLARLIFRSGFSTSSMITDISGRGVGMDVVISQVSSFKGSVDYTSVKGKGTKFVLSLPVSLTTSSVIIVEVAGNDYAIPLEAIDHLMQLRKESIYSFEGRDTVTVGDRAVSVVRLESILGIKSRAGSRSSFGDKIPCAIIKQDERLLGLLVDEVKDDQEVVLKAHNHILKKVRNVSGATILGSGKVCVVLKPSDLIRSASLAGSNMKFSSEDLSEGQVDTAKRILFADDSITTRTQLKRIMISAGYDVVIAVDGLDAWQKLSVGAFDAVVSDIEMPNMTGLELTEKIRSSEPLKDLPVILVTSLSSEDDKRKGLEVGASAYITKPSFDQKVLLETIERLV